MIRIPIIAGNWKMNKTPSESVPFVYKLSEQLNDVKNCEIVVAPPACCLSGVSEALKNTNIEVSAQNCEQYDSGAYTGELSPLMIKDLKCKYSIIGHSERRKYYNETNEGVNQKAHSLLKHGILPIMCIGEVLEEREAGKTLEVLKIQLENGLKDISEKDIKEMVIAYEPVWAIGTGKNATCDDAQNACKFIRNWIKDNYNEKASDNVRIQYGGSVKPENIVQYMNCEDIDGALVGGACLKVDSFVKIVKF